MLDKEWCYRGGPDYAGYAVAELNELHYETPGDTRRTWEKDRTPGGPADGRE